MNSKSNFNNKNRFNDLKGARKLCQFYSFKNKAIHEHAYIKIYFSLLHPVCYNGNQMYNYEDSLRIF